MRLQAFVFSTLRKQRGMASSLTYFGMFQASGGGGGIISQMEGWEYLKNDIPVLDLWPCMHVRTHK